MTREELESGIIEGHKDLLRYQKAAALLRSVALLNVISQDEVHIMSQLTGKVKLGSWQIEEAIRQAEEALKVLDEEEGAQATKQRGKKPHANNRNKGH